MKKLFQAICKSIADACVLFAESHSAYRFTV